MDEILGKAWEQIVAAPHEIWLLIFMTCFGIYWKKSNWPNKYWPVINFILPIVIFPALELAISDTPYHKYRSPVVVLAFWGAFIAVLTIFVHNGIISVLKRYFPKFEFPADDPPSIAIVKTTESPVNTVKLPETK